jgi:hypothetical protein
MAGVRDLDLARLVELSEARAYWSLFSSASEMLGEEGRFTALAVGSCVLLKAPSVRSSLVVNRVIGLGIEEPAAPLVLDLVERSYAEDDLAFGVELSPLAEPGHLVEWVKQRRWRKGMLSQILYREAAHPPPLYEGWSKSTGMRVENIGAAQADEVGRISCANFRMPEPIGALLASAAGAPGWRLWLALHNEESAGASVSYVNGDVCWLGWTSVLPAFRGRWVHAGIVARQLDDAARSGCRWVTTETAFSSKEQPDAAYFNLKKFGFVDVYQRPIYIKAPTRRNHGEERS